MCPICSRGVELRIDQKAKSEGSKSPRAPLYLANELSSRADFAPPWRESNCCVPAMGAQIRAEVRESQPPIESGIARPCHRRVLPVEISLASRPWQTYRRCSSRRCAGRMADARALNEFTSSGSNAVRDIESGDQMTWKRKTSRPSHARRSIVAILNGAASRSSTARRYIAGSKIQSEHSPTGLDVTDERAFSMPVGNGAARVEKLKVAAPWFSSNAASDGIASRICAGTSSPLRMLLIRSPVIAVNEPEKWISNDDFRNDAKGGRSRIEPRYPYTAIRILDDVRFPMLRVPHGYACGTPFGRLLMDSLDAALVLPEQHHERNVSRRCWFGENSSCDNVSPSEPHLRCHAAVAIRSRRRRTDPPRQVARLRDEGSDARLPIRFGTESDLTDTIDLMRLSTRPPSSVRMSVLTLSVPTASMSSTMNPGG